MNNTLLGKTITQLSDETDLSIDTINNLFYARVQKPGLSDVERIQNQYRAQLPIWKSFCVMPKP